MNFLASGGAGPQGFLPETPFKFSIQTVRLATVLALWVPMRPMGSPGGTLGTPGSPNPPQTRRPSKRNQKLLKLANLFMVYKQETIVFFTFVGSHGYGPPLSNYHRQL